MVPVLASETQGTSDRGTQIGRFPFPLSEDCLQHMRPDLRHILGLWEKAAEELSQIRDVSVCLCR